MLPSWSLTLPVIIFLVIHLLLLITTLSWIWPQRHLNLDLRQWNRLPGRLGPKWKLEIPWKGLLPSFVKLVVWVVFLSFSAFVWRELGELDSGLGLHFEDECIHQIALIIGRQAKDLRGSSWWIGREAGCLLLLSPLLEGFGRVPFGLINIPFFPL